MEDDTSTLGVRTRTKFSMTPRWIARAGKGLSPTAKALYTTIMSYANNDERRAFPGQELLGKDLGVSVSTIHRAMKELEKFGALEVERRRNPRTGNFYGNRYTLVFDEPMTSRDAHIPSSEPSVTSENGGLSPVTEEEDPLLSRPNLLTPSSADEAESSLRSPSLSERRTDHHLLELVRDVAKAQTDDDYEAASNLFIEELGQSIGEDIGYWDYGWSEKLDNLVRKHGLDYGTAKWLGIFTNSVKAA